MENKTNSPKGLKNQEIILKTLLAKSLVLFICIGLISGLVYGLYLYDQKNTSQLVFVEGPSISVVTEKLDFKQGEEMNIRIVNSGTTTLIFSDASYGLKITRLSGVLMYSPVAAQVISELEPGDEIKFLWNQIKNDNMTTSDGIYKISAKGMDKQGNRVEKSTTITILK